MVFLWFSYGPSTTVTSAAERQHFRIVLQEFIHHRSDLAQLINDFFLNPNNGELMEN
jgi:hypothetical protein